LFPNFDHYVHVKNAPMSITSKLHTYYIGLRRKALSIRVSSFETASVWLVVKSTAQRGERISGKKARYTQPWSSHLVFGWFEYRSDSPWHDYLSCLNGRRVCLFSTGQLVQKGASPPRALRYKHGALLSLTAQKTTLWKVDGDPSWITLQRRLDCCPGNSSVTIIAGVKELEPTSY